MQNQIQFRWKLFSGLTLSLGILLVAAAIGWFSPGIKDPILAHLQLRSPELAQWLKELSTNAQVVLMVLAMGLVAWSLIGLGVKLFSKSTWLALAASLQQRFAAPRQPAGTYSLTLLKDKLFPDADKHGKAEIPFFGREVELAWLHQQCLHAMRHGCGLHAVALWGAQGIGKTHVCYRFAKALADGGYPDCVGWQVYALDREFESASLLASLSRPALLIWDDISLSDDASKARLQLLRKACGSHKTPLVLLLTSWQARDNEGLTREQKLIDNEMQCQPLGLTFASQIYPLASQLEPSLQGHPLFLRLLQEQSTPASPSAGNPPKTLWALCQQWALDYSNRLAQHHQLSPLALGALAVVSSSDASTFNDLRSAMALTDADFAALKKTGRITNHQGSIRLLPIRPDLLGWAFAIQQLQTTEPQQLESWAKLAWSLDFFDTGRFLQHATTHDLAQNAWVMALHNPHFTQADAVAALARAKASTNAVNHYGSHQLWEPMAAELAISQAIALRFTDDAQIQLRYARCLLAKGIFQAKDGVESSTAFADLMRQLAVYPHLQSVPPFDEFGK